MGYALRKHHSCQKFVKTDGFELKFQAQPSPFTRHIGKCNICILNKKKYLKDQMSERSMVKSIGFDRFMTSEGTETLILVLTSKTGQSVTHNRHKIFSFGFFYQREDIFRHFIG